jgi:leucyl-tRNA synthetase
VIQVGGRVRARLEVTPDVSETELERLALAHPNVRRAIDGMAIRMVIVRAPKLVNVVVG